MDRHEHQDHPIGGVDVSRDDSLPLSDSMIPTSFELATEQSPVSSDGSDVFHTPEGSQLDIEGSQISAESPPTVESDAFSAVQPETRPTRSDLDSKDLRADDTDSDIFEYISRGIDSDDRFSESQDHPPASLSLLDDPNKPESGSKAPVLPHPGTENTDPVSGKLEARSERILPKWGAPIHALPTFKAAQGQVAIQEESRHLVSEPIAPPKLSDVVDVASQATPDAKSVPDKVVPLNLKSQTRFPSSGPRHTAEKPNWALAPDDPPKPRTTVRKKGERVYGPRRGKQPNGDSSPESIPPKSSKANHNNKRRSKPSSPLTSPAQKAMGSNEGKYSLTLVNSCGNSSSDKNLPYLPIFRGTDEKLSPSAKQAFKEVVEKEQRTLNTSSFYGLQVNKRTLLEPVRESSPRQPSSPRVTQGSPTSVDLTERSRSSSVSIKAIDKSDEQSLRRSPPWRRKSALLTIAESAPETVKEFRKGPSMILYQTFPPIETNMLNLKGVVTGEKKDPATEATKDAVRVLVETATSVSRVSNKRSEPEGPPQGDVRRPQPEATPARGVRKVGRLSWPSSEEDLKLHKTTQDREPLPWRSKANNQAFSRPYVPPIPSATLPPRPNQSAATVVEVGSFNSSKETLHLGTQNNSFHAQGSARVNLPSKPMHMHPDPQDPVTSLDTDSIRPVFSSNIPIPTRTQNRSGSIQDGPKFQERVDAMGLPLSGLETPGGLASTHRPKLPRHIYRSASQTFMRQPEFQVGNCAPNPSTNTHQEFHGLQYYSLAGHQPTPAIILPMPNDTSRPPVPPIPRSRPDYPFPDLGYVHNYQVNRACSQAPETPYTGITQPPTTAVTGRLHRSTSLYGGWRERHGLGLSQPGSGMSNAPLRSQNMNDSTARLASRGFPDMLQRNGNAAHLMRENPNPMN
ncbi:hypothetical protein M413DRAFT_313953 [Hebeloma cylindrosporum]|uniref:Uncharacterized protein n=1 Tax=Hebeloma cylindrosporum TaxID=76867 RepID=A0A0C3CQN5_HEBCY|nr:hypothetical protein M413DRAFT_313953 [Hebeloma cylindrosporum h7]